MAANASKLRATKTKSSIGKIKCNLLPFVAVYFFSSLKHFIVVTAAHRTTDLDEVLQTDAIFTNVSKGQVAKKDELQKVFGAATRAQIISEILHNGDIQLGEKERSHKLEASLKDIATIVYEKCVNPATQKPYSVAIIEKAIGDAHYSVHPTKSSKQQVFCVFFC